MKRLLALLYLPLLVTVGQGAAHYHTQSDFSRGANAALNETLIVGNEWHDMGLHFTWGQIDREVSRRLHLDRRIP
ncbi:MAG: hypothetical protein ABI162_06845 [Luteolibacter sp.]